MNRDNRVKVKESSRGFFENGIRGHSAVETIVSLGEDLYHIERTGGRTSLRILVADIYIFSELDLFDTEVSDFDAIVLIGFYNRYSNSAKKIAKDMGKGVFTFREFFGALNFTNDKFLNYVPKE